MLRTIYAKSLRDDRRALVGWSAGVVALVAAMAAFWPSVRDAPEFEQLLEAYPDWLADAFGIEAITTGPGFLNAELFSIMLPALFIVFAVSRGARLIAGEEDSGTLSVLLATPVPRTRVLADKAAALASGTVTLGAVLFVSIVAASAVGDMGVSAGQAAVGALSMTLLGLEHGAIAFAVGAATGRRGLAVGSATIVAAGGYVLFIAAAIVDAVRPYRVLSPFYQALENGPLGGPLPARYAWMAVVAVVVVAAATVHFERRDVATA